MFKNWRERNIKYYERNFKLLEKGQHAQFNWAAFFLGNAWFAYRKMYGCALLFSLIDFYFYLIIDRLQTEGLRTYEFFTTFAVLAFEITIANFANHIYYKNIKYKVKNGFNELEKYCPTSFSLGLLVFTFNTLLSPEKECMGIATIMILLLAVTDYSVNRFYSVDREKELDVSTQNIREYLNRKGPNHFWGYIMTFITYLLAIIAILSIKTTKSKIDHSKDIIQTAKEINEKAFKEFEKIEDPSLQKAIQKQKSDLDKIFIRIQNKLAENKMQQ